ATGSLERARALGLETPGRDLTALVLDIHQQPRVRVGELKLLDDALDGDGLLLFEHRRGMACRCRCSDERQEAGYQQPDTGTTCSRSHGLPPRLSSLGVNVR